MQIWAPWTCLSCRAGTYQFHRMLSVIHRCHRAFTVGHQSPTIDQHHSIYKILLKYTTRATRYMWRWRTLCLANVSGTLAWITCKIMRQQTCVYLIYFKISISFHFLFHWIPGMCLHLDAYTESDIIFYSDALMLGFFVSHWSCLTPW